MPQFRDHSFASDHPTAAGHFPGNPIIPGALLLDIVLATIRGNDTGAVTIRAVKFLRPVRPGDRIRITWHDERGETHFECSLIATGEVAATGTLRGAITAE